MQLEELGVEHVIVDQLICKGNSEPQQHILEGHHLGQYPCFASVAHESCV